MGTSLAFGPHSFYTMLRRRLAENQSRPHRGRTWRNWPRRFRAQLRAIINGERPAEALTLASKFRLVEVVDLRTTPGRRDYAILLLLVTYGLRACEVSRLTFDDIGKMNDYEFPNARLATVPPIR